MRFYILLIGSLGLMPYALAEEAEFGITSITLFETARLGASARNTSGVRLCRAK